LVTGVAWRLLIILSRSSARLAGDGWGMANAADAILNLAPTQNARPAPAAPKQTEPEDGSRFQDYVDAADESREAADDAIRAEVRPRRRTDRETEDNATPAQIAAAPAPPPIEVPAQPLILQLVVSAAPQTPVADAPVQAAAPQTAPTTPQAAAPIATPTPPQNAPTNAVAANTTAPSIVPTQPTEMTKAEAAKPAAPQPTQLAQEQFAAADIAPTSPDDAAQNLSATPPSTPVVQTLVAPAILVAASTKAPASTTVTAEAASLLGADDLATSTKPQTPLVEAKAKAAPQDPRKSAFAPTPSTAPAAVPSQNNANDIARNVANMIAPDVQAAPAPAAPASAQPIGLAQAGASQQPQTALEAASVRAAPIPAQIGREIIRRFNGQSTSFTLRLDPAELGRVDVRLDVSRDHRVTAVVQADNPQALAELSRGARELEQALQSAGLQLTENGLSFDLSDRRGAFAAQEKSNGARAGETAASAPDEPQAVARPIGLEHWRGVRVDLVA
jgi:flagellar hook-length control protein FliK